MSTDDTDVTRPPPTANADDRTVLAKPLAPPPPPERTRRGHGPLGPGQLLGNTYEIEALLARGGMGEVYRARHVELGSVHAIKVILPELAKDSHIITLFTEEARKLRRLRSDAIVGYEGLFRDEEGTRYLVMEFVNGPSLASFLKRRKLTVDEVRALRDRCASGLAAAHDKGIFHRDISPDNIILVEEKVELAKIIDFGIAKSSDPGDKTVVGTDFAGKYSYVAPEQLGMFGGKVDGRTDMYSLGLVLVAAARGRSIDMGNSPASVIQARQTVPDLTGIPDELRSEIAPMLEPDPAKRPPSMRHLPGARVGGAEASIPPPARPAPAEPKPAARSSGWLVPALIGTVAFVVIAGGGAYLLYPTLFPPQPEAPSKPSQGAQLQPPQTQAPQTQAPQQTQQTQPAQTQPQQPVEAQTQTPQTGPTQVARVQAPSRAAVQSQLQSILGRYDCAGLSAQVGEDLHATVTGFARTTDLPRLRAAVADLGPGVSVSMDAVAGYIWPHCALVQMLGPAPVGSTAAPRLTLNNPTGKYHNKDKLVLGVTAPSAGYLQLDYYDSSGQVIHVDWGKTPANEYHEISGPVEAPFGPNMAVALLSPKPLFAAARPSPEDARVYLTALQKALPTATAQDNYVLFDSSP